MKNNIVLKSSAKTPKQKINNPKLTEYVQAGKYNKVKRCLEKNCDVNSSSPFGNTPMHVIGFYNHPEVFGLLLKYNPNINAQNVWGETPLHKLAQKDPRGFAETLVNLGASLDIETIQQKRTPLAEAALAGNIKVVKLLLSRGANVNNGCYHINETPLYCAVQSTSVTNIEIIKLLLEHGADPDTDKNANNINETPLYYATRVGFANTVELLLMHGANPNKNDFRRDAPLYIAALIGRVEIVKLLLAYGADPNIKFSSGDTALHVNMSRNTREIARILLTHGADINSQNDAGNTPLHCAVVNNKRKLTKLLLENDANFMIKNNSQETPLNIAERMFLKHSWYKKIVLVLKNYEKLFLQKKLIPLMMSREFDEESLVSKDYLCRDMFKLIMDSVFG